MGRYKYIYFGHQFTDTFTSIFKYSSVAEKISSDPLNELIYFEASFIYIVSFIDGGNQRNP